MPKERKRGILKFRNKKANKGRKPCKGRRKGRHVN